VPLSITIMMRPTLNKKRMVLILHFKFAHRVSLPKLGPATQALNVDRIVPRRVNGSCYAVRQNWEVGARPWKSTPPNAAKEVGQWMAAEVNATVGPEQRIGAEVVVGCAWPPEGSCSQFWPGRFGV
jgi:hypothetical protein